MDRKYSKQGFLALDVDLYDRKVATTREHDKSDMQTADPNAATDALSVWVEWPREHAAGNGNVSMVG